MKKIIGSRRGSRPVKGAPALPPPVAPPPGGGGDPVAPTGDFFTTVTGAAEWMLAFDGAAGDEVRQIKGVTAVVGSILTGATIPSQPALDTAESNLSRAFNGAARARATGLATPTAGIGVLFQARPALSTQAVVSRRTSFTVTGGLGLACYANGKLDVYMATGESVYVVLETAAGVIVPGDVYLAVATYGAAGAKLYVTKAGGANPGTPLDTDASTALVAGAFDVDIGGNFNDSARFNGAIGYVWGYTTQPADAHVTALAALIKARVRHVQAVQITAEAGATTDFNPIPLALHGGDMTLQATVQPTNATLAVAAGPVLRVTGATAGTDNSTGRYTGTENAIVSAPAVVRVLGVTGSGGGGGVAGTLRNLGHPDNVTAFLHADYQGFTDPAAHEWYAMRNHRALFGRISYSPPGFFRIAGKYDHSPAGVAFAGDEIGKNAVARRINIQNARVHCINIEGGDSVLSVNVPNPLTDGTSYNPSIDTWRAHTDDINNRQGLRREVARWRKAVFDRARAYCVAAGYPEIEFADYNFPRKYLSGTNISPTDPRIIFEAANFADFADSADGTGPQAGQNWCTQTEWQNIIGGSASARNAYIAFQANQHRDRIQAWANVGRVIRPTALIWPHMYGPANAYRKDPMPAGMMVQQLDAFYAVGVRRFWCFIWRLDRLGDGLNNPAMTTTQRNGCIANYEAMCGWLATKNTEGKLTVVGTNFA